MWRRARPTRTATVEFRVDAQKHRRNEAKVRREPSIAPSRDVRFYGFFRDWPFIEKSRKSAKKNVGGADFEPSNVAFSRSPADRPELFLGARVFNPVINTLARKK